MPSDQGLSVEVRRSRAAITLVASGALDIATGPELRVAALAAANGSHSVVLDLRGVTFVDSSGLGTLLNLRGELRRAGVRLVVEADDGPVRRAIELTGLGELLDD